VILTDTHPLIWFTLGERSLGERACRTISQAIEEKTLLLSAISLWETSMLVRKKRIGFEVPLQKWVGTILDNGVQLVGVSEQVAVDAGQLPDAVPGDPADRIIVATAQALNYPLVTADRKILAYAAAGHLQAIDARL
jgi:PIN domain nuclease of toxin-antitoxin system